MSYTNDIRVANGLCRDCGEEPGRPYRCYGCRLAHAAREAARKSRLREARKLLILELNFVVDSLGKPGYSSRS